MAKNSDPTQYLSVLVERVISQNHAALEAVNHVQQKVAKLPHIEEKITEKKVFEL